VPGRGGCSTAMSHRTRRRPWPRCGGSAACPGDRDSAAGRGRGVHARQAARHLADARRDVLLHRPGCRVITALRGAVAAVGWGAADYCGARPSRSVRAYRVVFLSQVLSLPVIVVRVAATAQRGPDPAVLACGPRARSRLPVGPAPPRVPPAGRHAGRQYVPTYTFPSLQVNGTFLLSERQVAPVR
jgi:hypothetical protein